MTFYTFSCCAYAFFLFLSFFVFISKFRIHVWLFRAWASNVSVPPPQNGFFTKLREQCLNFIQLLKASVVMSKNRNIWVPVEPMVHKEKRRAVINLQFSEDEVFWSSVCSQYVMVFCYKCTKTIQQRLMTFNTCIKILYGHVITDEAKNYRVSFLQCFIINRGYYWLDKRGQCRSRWCWFSWVLMRL